MKEQPYHEGELAVQERAGEREIAGGRAGAVSSRIITGALAFLVRQRFVALSAAGDDGQLWTSVWFGAPGFVRSADGQHVSIDRSLMTVSPDDPVLRRLAIGRDVGILAVEFASRRRLRVNGTIENTAEGEVDILVRESLGNCPKYIRRRLPHENLERSTIARPTERGVVLDEERRALVEHADTVFVGSLHPERGVDTSHRGGVPGFIEVVGDTTLRVPDYPGNSMFLTLGNFTSDARASLAMVDFDRGRLVSLSGTALLRFGVEDPRHPTGGTARYWEFALREWLQVELPSPPRWELLDESPYNPVPAWK